MPKFTITVSENHLTRLQQIVQTYNANTGKTLTVADWMLLHLQEIAISDELAAAVASLKEQAETDATTAFEAAADAEQKRLIADLEL